jgi:hypothetical protein
LFYYRWLLCPAPLHSNTKLGAFVNILKHVSRFVRASFLRKRCAASLSDFLLIHIGYLERFITTFLRITRRSHVQKTQKLQSITSSKYIKKHFRRQSRRAGFVWAEFNSARTKKIKTMWT